MMRTLYHLGTVTFELLELGKYCMPHYYKCVDCESHTVSYVMLAYTTTIGEYTRDKGPISYTEMSRDDYYAAITDGEVKVYWAG